MSGAGLRSVSVRLAQQKRRRTPMRKRPRRELGFTQAGLRQHGAQVLRIARGVPAIGEIQNQHRAAMPQHARGFANMFVGEVEIDDLTVRRFRVIETAPADNEPAKTV